MVIHKNVAPMFDRKKRWFFFQRKLSFFIKPVLIISLIYILYQLIIFAQLNTVSQKEAQHNLILGTTAQQQRFYTPNEQNQFTCIFSMEVMDFKQVNDNYCDCQDGTDEPGTNACPNGQFSCSLQIEHGHYSKLIPSGQVNDGICDCCDGSDEWLKRELPFRLDVEVQKKLQRYQSPCSNRCG